MGKSSEGYGIGSFSRFIEAAWLTRIYSSSTVRTKSSGDRGPPWRTPLLHLKIFLGTPFNRTADDPEERMAFTHINHL
jgi:hypothetical protein